MELVALHAHQRHQRPAAPGPPEQGQVPQVGMDVFVDRVDFHRRAAHLGRRHAPHIRHRAVGHEPPAKTFHVAVRRVLAGLEDHDSEWIGHGASLVTATARRHRKQNKKADVVDHPEVFDYVGMLVNKPPGPAGLPLI